MGADEAVGQYHDAWQNKGGDFSEVPLAEDFGFTGRWRASTVPRGTGRWPARRAGP
jgi:hypothetical protein